MAETLANLASLLKLGANLPLQPPRFAKVVSVSGDTVTVSLGSGTADAVRCCACAADDVVLLETMPSGTLAAVAVKGYNGGSGGGVESVTIGTVNGATFTNSGTAENVVLDLTVDAPYTEDKGGTTMANYNSDGSNWPTNYAYTRNGSTISGCGWREVKHAGGRLEKWVWGWQQGQSSSDTYHMSNNWRELPIPAGTPFIDKPNVLMMCRCSNTGVSVWATQQGDTGANPGTWSSSGWTGGNSVGFSYAAYNHVGGAVAYPGKVLFQAYLDGHWE